MSAVMNVVDAERAREKMMNLVAAAARAARASASSCACSENFLKERSCAYLCGYRWLQEVTCAVHAARTS